MAGFIVSARRHPSCSTTFLRFAMYHKCNLELGETYGPMGDGCSYLTVDASLRYVYFIVQFGEAMAVQHMILRQSFTTIISCVNANWLQEMACSD